MVAVAVCGCGPMRSKSVDPETAAAVAALVESGNYRIYFDGMDPSRGGPRILSNDWNIELKDGVLRSYLPYFGEAFIAAIPGSHEGLDFESKVHDYTVKPGRKGTLEVAFWAASDEDRYDYKLTAYPDGNVYLRVIPELKTSIGFSGKFDLR